MKNKIRHLLLIIFVFTIPVFEFFNTRILFVLFTLTLLFIRKASFFQSLVIRAWDLILFFVVLVVGLTYTQDLPVGLRQIETSLSIIGIPVIMYSVSHFLSQLLVMKYCPSSPVRDGPAANRNNRGGQRGRGPGRGRGQRGGYYGRWGRW